MAEVSDKPEAVYSGGGRKQYMDELESRLRLGLLTSEEVKMLVPRSPDFQLLMEIYIGRLNTLYIGGSEARGEFERLVVKLGSSDVWVMAEKLASIAMEAKIRKELEDKATNLLGGRNVDEGLAAARAARAEARPTGMAPPRA